MFQRDKETGREKKKGGREEGRSEEGGGGLKMSFSCSAQTLSGVHKTLVLLLIIIKKIKDEITQRKLKSAPSHNVDISSLLSLK